MLARPLFALLATSLLATVASAEPDPRFSTIDAVAVGSPLGVAIGGSPAGYDVTMRDVSNAPRPGVIVELRLGAAGLKLYADQAAGTTIDCLAGTLSRVTDAQGQVKFVPRFGGWVDNNAIEVFGGGDSLGFVKGRSPDYDKDGKVGLSDLVTFSNDFLTNPAAQKSDHVGSKSVYLPLLAKKKLSF
jgi:hypothetical protein